jgi:hypothetical protein
MNDAFREKIDEILENGEIWSAVILCEKEFRNSSNDVSFLKLQAEILLSEEDPIYRATYMSEALIVCNRILKFEPNNAFALDTPKTVLEDQKRAMGGKGFYEYVKGMQEREKELEDNNFDDFLKE